jgi:hypothetical protein
VTLEHLLRLAADQANEVVRLNGAPNGHRGLGLLFRRRLDFSANLGNLTANGGVMSVATSDRAILLFET